MIKTKVSCLVALAGLAVAIGCSSPADSPSPTATVAAAPVKAAVTPDMLAKGAAIYKANCAACHGDGGKGDGPGAGVLKPPPRDHTDPVYMKTLTDKNIADVIVMGGAMKGKPLMPSHPQLRGPELDALVAHVRSLSAGQ
jgi:mono/diheme cytochrome c family protein